MKKRKVLFDRWSENYDQNVHEGEFPFIGYKKVLMTLCQMADVKPGQRLLDLGVGTGNLSKRLIHVTDLIWGADFSHQMLKKARAVLPQSHLIQVDLVSEDWPKALQGPFDRILSAYTLHEFSDVDKTSLLLRLARQSLAEDGMIVIGDISFQTPFELSQAHQKYSGLWDEEEYYWCAEKMLPQLREVGFETDYEQVSSCAGVYRLTCGRK